jgi:hypothetical protein
VKAKKIERKNIYMKKIMALLFLSLFIVTLSACATGNETDVPTIDTDEISHQLATSIYLSQGLLQESSTITNTSLVFLNTTTEPVVESRMDQMMRYFDRINILIGTSPEDALDFNISESSKTGYEQQVSYQFNTTTYTIYFNVVDALDDEELDENEFTLEGLLEYGDVSLDIIGGTELEEGELEMFFETYNNANDDYVRVEIEQSETEQYFEVETSFGGEETYSEIRLEKDGVDGAIEIYIEEDGLDSYYEITKEIDGQFTIYYFEYIVGDTSGSIQLTEYVVDDIDTQHFIIEEDNLYKEYTIPENQPVPDDM